MRILEIDKGVFKKRTKIKIPKNIDFIVSLRDVDKITNVEIMPKKTLESLLRNVPINNKSKTRPYISAKISLYKIDPSGLYIGQTFVQENKILNTLSLSKFFEDYHTPGISKMPPLVVYGKSKMQDVIAFYIPPIIESFDSSFFILDGIHRSYIAKGAGTTMYYIVITKEQDDLPLLPTTWDKIDVVKEKPPLQERYFNLKKENFRRLDYVGIDG